MIPRRDAGFALLLVLILVTLLAAIVAQAVFVSQVDLSTSARRLESVRHEAALRAGLVEAKRLLVYDHDQDVQEQQTIDSLDEPWAQAHSIPISEDLSVELRIRDEGSNLNLAHLLDPQGQPQPGNRSRLERLLAQFPPEQKGEASDADLLEALYDWADKAPQGGPETGRFETNAKNAPPYTLEELRLVPGFTDRLLYGYAKEDGTEVPGIAAFLSARWGDGRVNVNTAGAETLRTLSEQMSEDKVQAILARRKERPFASIQEVADLFPSWTTFMQDVGANLQTTTLFFAVEITSSIGKTEGTSGSARRLVAHLQRVQQEITVYHLEPQ